MCRTGHAGWPVPACPRSAVLTSRSRPGGPVMACWHWNRQVTQPPAAARRLRADMAAANTSAAATAVATSAAVTATTRPAVLKKCSVGFPNARKMTSTMPAIMLTGRA